MIEKINYKEQEITEDEEYEFEDDPDCVERTIKLIGELLNVRKISKSEAMKYLLEHRKDHKISKYALAIAAGNFGMEDRLPNEYLDILVDMGIYEEDVEG